MGEKKLQDSAPDVKLAESEGMFSAASFAGVLNQYDDTKWEEPEVLPPASPPVVAFYGFRGGAGRTTALAYVAAFMASRQRQVVAIDLDVEAPGLHHVLDCPTPEENSGTVAFLREAATMEVNDLRLSPHVLKSGVDVGASIRVIPAGRLSEHYLERLDDLGVPLWHVLEGPSPLQILVDQVKSELGPQMIFLDCRTGLNGLSASAVFHVADIVVCFLPVSEQSLEGLEIFLKGLKAAKLNRKGRPDVLIVPSMVPEGPDGQQRLRDWFIPQIEDLYARVVIGLSNVDDDTDWMPDQAPIVREGIEYRRGIALADHLRRDFAPLSGGAYQMLIQNLDSVLGEEQSASITSLDTSKVLSELVQYAGLKNLAFAESTSPEEIVRKFIPPSDFKNIVDRGTWYVKGAKGAGKTWLWTFLLSETARITYPEMTYIAAHGPREELLSATSFRELEKNRRDVNMRKRGLHGALWLFYAAKRLLSQYGEITDAVVAKYSGEERRLIRALADQRKENLINELTIILKYKSAGTLAERLLRTLDAELLVKGLPAVTLLYDGLDVGFGSDREAIDIRGRYVSGLVEAVDRLRGVNKRIFFKLFLREDIFADLNLQNQSHLAAATTELRWEPRDLWWLALNLVAASPHYLDALHAVAPSAAPNSWPPDEKKRVQLLAPLWGARMERGNKTATANFVQRRTADGKDRLFPRTLVQLLEAAVTHQQTIETRPDRVLRSAAIIAGYNRASKNRLDDLKKEYSHLSFYLDGLKGMTPTGTEDSIVAHIKKQTQAKATKKGAKAGALHAGPQGWRGVIDRLLEIGVLREYKRVVSEDGKPKYEVALLYRPGIGIKAYGV